jgi:hypothetical protein
MNFRWSRRLVEGFNCRPGGEEIWNRKASVDDPRGINITADCQRKSEKPRHKGMKHFNRLCRKRKADPSDTSDISLFYYKWKILICI